MRGAGEEEVAFSAFHQLGVAFFAVKRLPSMRKGPAIIHPCESDNRNVALLDASHKPLCQLYLVAGVAGSPHDKSGLSIMQLNQLLCFLYVCWRGEFVISDRQIQLPRHTGCWAMDDTNQGGPFLSFITPVNSSQWPGFLRPA